MSRIVPLRTGILVAIAVAHLACGDAAPTVPTSPKHPPTAAMVIDAGGEAALMSATEVVFAASGSPDFDPATTTYKWDFGDSTTASGSPVTHVYHDSAVFNVVVWVSDGKVGAGASGKVDVRSLTGTWVSTNEIVDIVHAREALHIDGRRTDVAPWSPYAEYHRIGSVAPPRIVNWRAGYFEANSDVMVIEGNYATGRLRFDRVGPPH